MNMPITEARPQPDAKLLVVEDDPNIIELLSASLRYAGFEVITAEAGTEAVRGAQRHRPAPILVHKRVPGMHGVNAIRRVAAARFSSPPPSSSCCGIS